MKKLITLLLVCSGIALHAQDAIVKTDQTEIKAKVTEIAETVVKYKKWDNLDGPLYNIPKTEVFMIIYANGKRETFAPQAISHTDAAYGNRPAGADLHNAPESNRPISTPAIDTVINYKNIRVKYAPIRFSYWFQSPTTLGMSSELRIVKNTLNFGGSVDYFFISGAEQTLYSLYLAPYFPLNRLMGNYENQDKGLFIYARIGYASLSYSYGDYSGSTANYTAGLGMDYFFAKHIGLSLGADKFGDGNLVFKGGITFK